MTRKLPFLLGAFTMLFAVAGAQNSVPNGDFESWTTTDVETPHNLVSSNTNGSGGLSTPGCTKSTDAYHGNYALTLTSHLENGNVNTAFVGNIQPNGPPPWNGGIPYNQMPTGLKGFYKSNIPAGDSALIVVNFSKDGTGTNVYMTKLYGLHDTYTPFFVPFNPPLSVQPDSVIILFVSDDPLTGVAFDGSTLTVDSINFTGVTSQPAMLNGDFEQWDTQSIVNLNEWYQQGSYNGNMVMQTTDRVSGNFAAQLTTFQGDHNGVPNASSERISTGYWDNSCNCLLGGKPYNQTIDTLVFWYKYQPMNSDTGQMNIYFKNTGTIISMNGSQLLPTNVYQSVEIPISLFQAPDSVVIEFMSSLWSDTLTDFVGSVLKVDNVYFKSQAVSVPTVFNMRNGVSVFPNPCKESLTIQSGMPFSTIEVYDNTGELVFTKNTTSLTRIKIDTNGLPSGIYFYKLKDPTKLLVTGKFVVE